MLIYMRALNSHMFHVISHLCKINCEIFFLLSFFPQIQWDAPCFYPRVQLCGLDLSQPCLSLISVLTRSQGKTWGGLFTARWFSPLHWCGFSWMSSYSCTSVNVTNVMTRRSGPCYLRSGVSTHKADVSFIQIRMVVTHGKTWHFKIRVLFLDLEEHLGRIVNVH